MTKVLSDDEQKNIKIIRRWIKEVWIDRRREQIDALMSPDCLCHYENAQFKGATAWKELYFEQMIRAVPDIHVEIDNAIASEENVVARWRASGTQKGVLFGVAPTNRVLDLNGIQWTRVVDGQIVELWNNWNISYVLRGLIEEVQLLRKIVPLCSFCKKVRDEKGYWEQVDTYLQKYTQSDVSHSLCLECMKREYPEIYTDNEPEPEAGTKGNREGQ